MKAVWIMLGSISLILGIVGIFLPLLPTTPFLLLTASLYLKGSPKLYHWLINQPYLGVYIQNFREHRIVPLRTKIISNILLWGVILYSIFFVVSHWTIQLLLFCVAVGVSWHILSFKHHKTEG